MVALAPTVIVFPLARNGQSEGPKETAKVVP